MKKITIFILLFLLGLSPLQAQVFTVPTCSSTSSSNYGPMYSLANANATSRTAVVYPSVQLATLAGKTISGMYFHRTSTTGAMLGNPNFKIYVKEITAPDFGEGALDWATAITGATLVYDSNPSVYLGTNQGWKFLPLATNFTYSGTQNLAVFFEYINTSSSSTISWYHESLAPCVNPSNTNVIKYSNNTTGTLPTSLTVSDYRRPFIGFEYLVACNAPIAVTVASVTSNSAAVTWTAPGVLPSNGYEYYLSNSASVPATTTVATGVVPTQTNLNLSDLVPNTTYYLWVRSVCDAGTKSNWRAAAPFKTLCQSVTDFIQNFDTTTVGLGLLPDCWSRAGTSNNVSTLTGGSAPGSPPNRLYMNITSSNSAFAIMPSVSNLQSNTHRLKFKAYATALDKFLHLGYFSDPSDITSFVLLQAYALPSATPVEALEYTYVPTTIPVGIDRLVFTMPTGVATTIYIDDVKWEVNSTCVEPNQLTVAAITDVTAQIGWTGGSSQSTWEVQYGFTNFLLGTGTVAATITTNSFLLTGLVPNSGYQFYVRGICDATNPSAWAGPFSFSTFCSEATSFAQNFEGAPVGSANPLPECWTRAGNGSVYNTGGSVTPFSPVNHLYMYSNGGATPPTIAYAIMPPVSNLQANTHRLKFKAFATSSNRTLEVGFLTDPTNLSTYEFIQEINLPATTASTAQEFVVIPGALPAGVKYLVFKNPGIPGNTTTLYIDDVQWQPIPTCTEPSVLEVDQITANSAELSWLNGASETAWEIQYGVTGFVLGTGTTIPATTNPFVLNGLLANTNYTCYVRAVCSTADSSEWSGSVSFQTLCNDVAFFTENFDGYASGPTNPLPQCWSKVGNGSTYISTGSGFPMSPSNYLYLTANGTASTPTEVYAILPPVSNLQANTHRLKFKAYASALNRTIEVGYMTNPTEVNTYVFLTEISLPGTTVATAQEFTIVPGALPAGVKYLVFRNPGSPLGITNALVDDVKWEPIPSCIEPSNLVLNSVTGSSVTIGWTNNSTATSWQIEYGVQGFTLGSGTQVITTTNPFTITNLLPNTNYQFYVRSVCSITDNSSWTGPLAAKTLCGEFTTFTQDFSGYATGILNPLPDCWSRLGTGESFIASSTGAPMTPPNRLFIRATNEVSPATQALVILPAVSNLSNATHQLKFKGYSNLPWRILEIGYLTNTANPSTFVLLQSYEMPYTAVTNSQDFTYAPPALPAGIKNLVLRNAPTLEISSSINLDDFSWEVIPDLSTGGFDTANFSYYPNPVADVLTMSYTNIISEVVVYNLLGQQVMTVQPNATQTQMDLSGLTNGTYLVKVTSEETVKTIKVIKK